MNRHRGMQQFEAGQFDPSSTPEEQAEADRLAKVIAIRDAVSLGKYNFDGLLAQMFSGGICEGKGMELPAMVDSFDR